MMRNYDNFCGFEFIYNNEIFRKEKQEMNRMIENSDGGVSMLICRYINKRRIWNMYMIINRLKFWNVQLMLR